jgi:hypothetical protein
MNTREEYFAKMRSNFRRWDAEMGMLIERGAEMQEDLRAAFDERLRAMRSRRDMAYRKLQEIRSASDSGWRRLQGDVDGAWSSMRHAMQRAMAESKNPP